MLNPDQESWLRRHLHAKGTREHSLIKYRVKTRVKRANRIKEKISCQMLLVFMRLARKEVHLHTAHCTEGGKRETKGVNGYCIILASIWR